MGLPVLITLALSLDGFFVGAAYGLRRIQIPVRSLCIVALCTGVGMAVSMLLGDLAGEVISERTTQLIGAIVLGVLGLWQLVQGWIEYAANGCAHKEEPVLFRVQVKALGVVIQLLREPTRADADRSGVIDPKEALVLGMALGMDALAAGFGAAMLDFGGPFLILLVTLGLLLLTWLGLRVGRRYGHHFTGSKALFVPGALLLLVALIQL